MKKIGKNTKLYLIGMIIGGITLGITTVIADTIINSTSVAYKTTTVKAALDELYDIADFKEEVKDMLYPVGSIYISVSGTNPSELFGGTWEAFGMGRTLIGVGSNQNNTDNTYGKQFANVMTYSTAEVRGGEYGHDISNAELPPRVMVGLANSSSSTQYINGFAYGQSGISSGKLVASTIQDFAQQGGNTYWNGTDRTRPTSEKANLLQPYITVFMWKRTA